MSYLRVSLSAFEATGALEPPRALEAPADLEAPAAVEAPEAKLTGRVSLDCKTFNAVQPAAQAWRWPTAPVYISAPERPRRILPYVVASASALVLVALGLVWAL